MSETTKNEMNHCGDECGTPNECTAADKCLGYAAPSPEAGEREVREALVTVLYRADTPTGWAELVRLLGIPSADYTEPNAWLCCVERIADALRTGAR